MSSSTNEVIKTSLNRKVDLRTAAYINAITRLDEFYTITGIHWSIIYLILSYKIIKNIWKR